MGDKRCKVYRDVYKRQAFDGKPIRGFENVLQRLIASYENIGFKRGRSVMTVSYTHLSGDCPFHANVIRLYSLCLVV